ncbi:MAG: glycosyl transferase [wastewater metagenome]|nr:glycosyl transferase [Candidatus Loosdrechtia aerotolerans]
MGDFFQNGEITTLHRFNTTTLEKIEHEIEQYAGSRPVALVLPITPVEMRGPALPGIVHELKEVNYINQIVVALGRFTKHDFQEAIEFFSVLPQETKLIWNDGKNIQNLYNLLNEEKISAGIDGKGRSAWLAYGYVLATDKSRVIALHDCDIINYDRKLLAHLCYPVVNPNLDFEFCKGYYHRVTDRMHGRVTRLFVTPFIRSLRKTIGCTDFLEYLDSFRYPLAGEFSMVADLARINRIPGDWGLEVGVLSEVYRNCSKRRICQVDICETYEHKHQPLSDEDPTTGLTKMSIDIAKSIYKNLASMGIVFSSEYFKTLKATYQRIAHEFIEKYNHDSIINGLFFDRHQEMKAVDAFTKSIGIAGEQFLEDPSGIPFIPNWNRITSAIPDFFYKLMEAVESDNLRFAQRRQKKYQTSDII